MLLGGEGMKRIVSGITLMPLLLAMLSLPFNIKLIKAEWTGTVYIRSDGRIDLPDAPIITYDNVTYTLTDNIDYGIVVERDDIIVDGAGYTVTGGLYGAVSLVDRSNVTIKNMEIEGSGRSGTGVYLERSSNNIIYGNNITDKD